MEQKTEEAKECCMSKKSHTQNYLLVALVAAILLVSVVQSFQIASIKKTAAANAVPSGQLDMSGWTENEKMNYEHHGTIPARAQQAAPQANMVGGC